MSDKTAAGKIGWIDMTVDDAPAVREFYEAVVGWKSDASRNGLPIANTC